MLFLALGLFASPAHAKCTFGEKCWPSQQAWASLNSTLGGHLLTVFPPAAVCHNDRGLFNAAACTVAQQNWTNSFWRSDQPGAYEDPFWENGYDQCYINSSQTAPCQQGLVPVVAADVQNVQDVQASVKFAAKHDLLLVVKNTGHDYLGRSSGAGGFSIWTHHLRGIEFSTSFTPAKCSSSAAVSAVSVAAGEQWDAVYRAADANGVVVVGGGAHSVGAAGGWLLGGGHSPLSFTYGLGVDNVIQFTIVLADGSVKTVSACSDSDLFWALRGGGGSAFGVVTSVVYKTHPPIENILVTELTWNGATPNDSIALAGQFFKTLPKLMDANWSGYSFIGQSLVGVILFQFNSPFAGEVAARNFTGANATFAPLFDFVAQSPSTRQAGNVFIGPFPSFLSFFEAIITDVSIGTDSIVGSRIIDRDVLEKHGDALAELCLASVTVQCNPNFVAGGAVSKVPVNATSVHPSWRTSLALFDLGSGFAFNATASEKKAVQAALTATTQQFGRLAGPQAGSYFNEADAREPEWQQVFWGPHYPRLLKIKKEVDPDSVFTCNRCVGSEFGL